jgi:hypothetical protein
MQLTLVKRTCIPQELHLHGNYRHRWISPSQRRHKIFVTLQMGEYHESFSIMEGSKGLDSDAAAAAFRATEAGTLGIENLYVLMMDPGFGRMKLISSSSKFI